MDKMNELFRKDQVMRDLANGKIPQKIEVPPTRKPDLFQPFRNKYGAMGMGVEGIGAMLTIIRDHHASYRSSVNGFVSMSVDVYDIETINSYSSLILYQARYTAATSGTRPEERQRQLKFHLAIIKDGQIEKVTTIESPHGRIRRWIQNGLSPLSVLPEKEPTAKSF